MTCTMCGSNYSDTWVVVAVPDDATSGAICSTDCLVEYAARVFATEIEDDEPNET